MLATAKETLGSLGVPAAPPPAGAADSSSGANTPTQFMAEEADLIVFGNTTCNITLRPKDGRNFHLEFNNQMNMGALILDLGGGPLDMSPLSSETLTYMLTRAELFGGKESCCIIFSTFPSLADHLEALEGKDYKTLVIFWQCTSLTTNEKKTPRLTPTLCVHPIIIGHKNFNHDGWVNHEQDANSMSPCSHIYTCKPALAS